jgi:hypothetical protein
MLLAAAGRTVESLPGDMQAALSSSTLAISAVKRYLQLDTHWFTALFMPIQGVLVSLFAFAIPSYTLTCFPEIDVHCDSVHVCIGPLVPWRTMHLILPYLSRRHMPTIRHEELATGTALACDSG